MRRIRIFALGIVSFVAALMGALLAPGTFVNRALSAALCTVFSFNSTICTVNLAKSSDRVVAATPPATERNISDWLVQRAPGEFDDAPSAPSGSNPQAPPFPQDPGPNQPVRPDFDNRDLNQPTQPQRSSCSLTGTWIYSLYVEPADNALVYRLPLQINQEGNQVSMAKSRSGSFQSRKNISNLMRVGNGQSITETLGNLTAKTIVDVDGATQWGEIREHTSGESIYFVMERQTPCVPYSPISELPNFNHNPYPKITDSFVKLAVASIDNFSETTDNNPKLASASIDDFSEKTEDSQYRSNIRKIDVKVAASEMDVQGTWLLYRPEFKLKVVSNGGGCYRSDRQTQPNRNINIRQNGFKVFVDGVIGKIRRPDGSLVVETYSDGSGSSGTIEPSGKFTLAERSAIIPKAGINSWLTYQGNVVLYSPPPKRQPCRITGQVSCSFGQNQSTATGAFSLTRQGVTCSDSREDSFVPSSEANNPPNEARSDSVGSPIENKPLPSFQRAFQTWATQNNPPSELVKLADAARDFATNNPDAITFVSNAAMLMTIIGGAGLALHSLVAGAGLTGAGTAAIETTATTATATEAGTAFNAANAFSKLGKFAPEIYKTLENVL